MEALGHGTVSVTPPHTLRTRPCGTPEPVVRLEHRWAQLLEGSGFDWDFLINPSSETVRAGKGPPRVQSDSQRFLIP